MTYLSDMSGDSLPDWWARDAMTTTPSEQVEALREAVLAGCDLCQYNQDLCIGFLECCAQGIVERTKALPARIAKLEKVAKWAAEHRADEVAWRGFTPRYPEDGDRLRDQYVQSGKTLDAALAELENIK